MGLDFKKSKSFIKQRIKMRKYIIKKTKNFVMIEEDWKQSIIADTYTYLLVVFLFIFIYGYSISFGRSIIFELFFVIIFGAFIFSKFKSKHKIIDAEEARKELDNFFTVVSGSFHDYIIQSPETRFYGKMIKPCSEHELGRIYSLTKFSDNTIYSGDNRGLGHGGYVSNIIDTYFEPSCKADYENQ